MGKITIDQSHQVIATLAVNTDWESIDFKNSGLQDFIVRNPKEAGRQFTAFLSGRVVGEPKTIKIDRSTPFDPVTFFSGEGLSIEEEDERAIALTEVDFKNVRLEAMLKPGETCVNGEEKLKRLKKAKHIRRLDAKIFQILWENQFLIPEKWKEKINGNTTSIFFDGTVLRNSNGNRYVPYLYWNNGKWNSYFDWLDSGFVVNSPSAVLAS